MQKPIDSRSLGSATLTEIDPTPGIASSSASSQPLRRTSTRAASSSSMLCGELGEGMRALPQRRKDAQGVRSLMHPDHQHVGAVENGKVAGMSGFPTDRLEYI